MGALGAGGRCRSKGAAILRDQDVGRCPAASAPSLAPARCCPCCCTTTCQLLLYYSAARLHTKWPGPALPNTRGCGAPKGAVRRRTHASSLGQPRAHNESRARLHTHKNSPRATHARIRHHRRSVVGKATPQAEGAHHRVQGGGAVGDVLALRVRVGWGRQGDQMALCCAPEGASVPACARATPHRCRDVCAHPTHAPQPPPRALHPPTRPGARRMRPWRWR